MSAFVTALPPTLFLWIVRGVALIVFLVGSSFVWSGFSVFQLSRESMTWPSVQGMARTVGMGQTGGPAQPVEYSPYVEYLYVVNGTNYSSSMISFAGSAYYDEAAAQAEENRYGLGQGVTVYYSPSHPDLAVLERGRGEVRGDSFIAEGLGWIAASIVIGWAVSEWNCRRLLARKTVSN